MNLRLSQSGRGLLFAVLSACLGLSAVPAQADLSTLTNKDASSGLKLALTRGAEFAVTQLSQPDGFMGNPQVKIPLPASLQKADQLARQWGFSRQADEVILSMNRAAESAVVEAKPLLVNAVKKMTLSDAKEILSGPDDAATQYFRRVSSEQLALKFLPIVKKSTSKLRLADKYNQFAGKAAQFGLLDEKDANLDQYVTQKAIDGLFVMVAEQEKQIRADPIGTGSKLLSKVFGAVIQ